MHYTTLFLQEWIIQESMVCNKSIITNKIRDLQVINFSNKKYIKE